jgi:triosephosphate isomerase
MRQKIIIGNWKMNTTRETGRKLAEALVAGCGQVTDVRIGVCPPACYLMLIGEELRSSSIGLGAQNCHYEKKGAFTGEISPVQLADLGCRYVILGHSERRHGLGETDAFINKKVKTALSVGLEVILCVGETQGERNADQTHTCLTRQLTGSLDGVDAAALEKVILAYEPVWAIGTGVIATPEQAQDAHAFIRGWIRDHHGEKSAARIPILYGGSATAATVEGLLALPDLDGGLVGGASLIPEDFLKVIQLARR